MSTENALAVKLNPLSDEEKEALADLLDGNGITEEQFATRADQVKELEMFLFNFPKMLCLDLFPQLRSLTLTQQGISKIENLNSCAMLESLWLNENSIETIEGLESCKCLTRLYLFSNRIRRIENLQHCTRLEVLWLADNQIVALEGLDDLHALRELNLARNQIDEIGDALSRNTGLEVLNLADNQVGAFKEVCYLSRLPKLVDLSFNDPHWGECPIAGLCNYQTYVLFNIRQLTSLDTLALPEETKQLAEATFMKKKMYYNMRIKTLRRNTNNAIRRADQGRAAKVGTSVEVKKVILRHFKDIEGELGQVKSYSHYNPDPSYVAALESKSEKLNQAIAARTAEIKKAQDSLDECKARVHELSNEYVRRLIVELETGGNIRLEDGKLGDLWYSSCVDLVNSRFFAADFATLGITGLKVNRVTRIHNRFLRNRFEERLESMVDVSDSTYKRSLEYLFYGESPELPGELLRAAEDGFRHPSEYAALGLDGAVTLSNSISVIDVPRLKEAPASYRTSGGRSPLVGQVLVSKVFLGKCVQESALASPATGSKQSKKQVLTSKAEYPDCNSVFRVKQGDPKQRQWYVFDNALVLPEYLVEYEYEASFGSKFRFCQPSPVLSGEGQAALDGLDADVRLIARPLVPMLLAAEHADLDDNGQPIVRLTGTEDGMELLKEEPQVAAKPAVEALTEGLLRQRTGAESLAMLTYLNLHAAGIERIEGLSGLQALKTLLLSFNAIQKMEGLSELHMLERLDLSYNSIRRIEGLKGLLLLRDLDLSSNLLHRLEDVNVLKKYVPELVAVDLSGNPLCTYKTYRTLMLRRLSKLQHLDQSPVSDEDREGASDNTTTLTVQMIKDHAFSRRSTSMVAASISSIAQSAAGDSWWRQVEEIVVEHQRVRRIQNLEKLTSLRRASFVDNELTRLEGLDFCTALEELSVEDNRIMAIEGLSHCTGLKKLELGKNKISHLENLGALTSLTQLSVEDNEIESLAGLGELLCLMELYIGNNRLRRLREILVIRDLPKLIIVDLLGNPLCREEDYRLYTIYHLKKLKVLDGTGIEASEQSAARNKYAGRLSLETLESKVGHRHFESLRELDISGLRVRDAANCFQSPEFSGLQEINLDNNIVSDVQGFAHLPNLSVLRLGANRIGEGCRFDVNPYNSASPFAALQVLQLGQNSIASIERLGLSKLAALRSLFLQGNDITRIDGLEGLYSLQELVLDRNRIKYVDAGALDPVQNLRELRMEENGLRSLSNLGNLPHLQALHLGYNRISDTSEIERITGLKALLEITLMNNPVVRKQVYRAVLLGKLPMLRIIDGRDVTEEERDYVQSMYYANSAMMDGTAAPGLVLSGAYGAQSQSQQQQQQKVPVKMTAVNFEQLAGSAAGGGMARGDDLAGPAVSGMGLELQGGGLNVMGQRGAALRPASNDRAPPAAGYVIGGRSVGNSGGPMARGSGRAVGGIGGKTRQMQQQQQQHGGVGRR